MRTAGTRERVADRTESYSFTGKNGLVIRCQPGYSPTAMGRWLMNEINNKVVLKDIQLLLRTGIKLKQLEAKYEDSE